MKLKTIFLIGVGVGAYYLYNNVQAQRMNTRRPVTITLCGYHSFIGETSILEAVNRRC